MLRPGLILKGSSALETLDDRRVGERDDLSFGRTKFWDRLKGDRNAYEEIGADDVSDSLAACVTFFGACVAIVHAHAQGRSSDGQINRQVSPY
jgi:hypothetical protein